MLRLKLRQRHCTVLLQIRMPGAGVALNIKNAGDGAHRQADVSVRNPLPIIPDDFGIRGAAPRLAIVKAALLDAVTRLAARRRKNLPASSSAAECSIKQEVVHF